LEETLKLKGYTPIRVVTPLESTSWKRLSN